MSSEENLNEFNVSFEEFLSNLTSFENEIKQMVINNHSTKELEETLKNGTLALTTMSFRIKDVNLQSGFALSLVHSTLRKCNDMAFGYLKELLQKQGGVQ